MRYYRIFGELHKTYGIPEDSIIAIAPTTGQILEDKEG